MLTTSPTITGFYAGILAILYIALSFNVIRYRRSKQVGIGDGNDKDLAKAIRVHGNFAEYVPLALILLAIYELSGAQAYTVHVLGGAFVAARFLHALGLSKSIGVSWQRFVGTLSTFLVLLILAVVNITAQF
ncbi:MAPEG family protein [Thalassotalea ponticola]|uniref:MAPEG family protein n=1 Tax=Thalassotalea ponticola TaxID=1523392 RepID=UPI0025B5FA7C|nr:MAPEG family protein [Thalassotalea ponticola]MDN3651313.1 MAPEG family protein [Thalassotalea ponticola]